MCVLHFALAFLLCSGSSVSASGQDHGDRNSTSGQADEYATLVKALQEILSHEVRAEEKQRESVNDEVSLRFLKAPSEEKSAHTFKDTGNTSSRTLDRISRRTLYSPEVSPKSKKSSLEPSFSKSYLNEWVVHMSGGENVAARVVKELGYKFHGSVVGFEDLYRISHLRHHHDHKREASDVTNELNAHPHVFWAEQQIARTRVKRDLKMDPEVKRVKHLRAQERLFNDPLWKHQWYLFDSRTRDSLPELDLKVISVWESGITGKGVNVVIVDDGLDWKHSDLRQSYNANISYDLNEDDMDPSPRYDQARTNSHGTKCAGEIAMQPNNNKCGVGVAYGASIGGIRMLDGEVSDRLEGTALAMNRESVDIISCSWGPQDNGEIVEGPGTLAKMALERGVKEGREGKGIIFVWASGNGGYVNDNCNCDGYVSSIYTVSVSSASENGDSPWYSEHCASTLTSTYSSGAYSDQKIVTTDLEDDCTVSFSGTSASTPLAAGIIALALQAKSE